MTGAGSTLAAGTTGVESVQHTHASDVTIRAAGGTNQSSVPPTAGAPFDSYFLSTGAQSTTHTHGVGAMTGAIGKVTGGSDGNADFNTGAASATDNQPAFKEVVPVVKL
jgi:hypothetical protein